MKALVCWNVTWLDSVTIKISYAINRFSVIIFYNGIKIIISAAIGKYFYGHRCYGVSSNDQIIAIQGIKCSLINDTSRWWSSGGIALPIKLRLWELHTWSRCDSCYELSYNTDLSIHNKESWVQCVSGGCLISSNGVCFLVMSQFLFCVFLLGLAQYFHREWHRPA